MYTRSKDRSPFPSNHGEHQTLMVTVPTRGHKYLFLTMRSMSSVLWSQPLPGCGTIPKLHTYSKMPSDHDGLDIEYAILFVKAEKKRSTYG